MTSIEADCLRHGDDVFVVLPPETGMPARPVAAFVEGQAAFLAKSAAFVTVILHSGKRVTVSSDRVFTQARLAMFAATLLMQPGA